MTNPDDRTDSFLFLSLTGKQMTEFIPAVEKIFLQKKYRDRVMVNTQTSGIYLWRVEISAFFTALLLEFVAELAMEMPLEQRSGTITDDLEGLVEDDVEEADVFEEADVAEENKASDDDSWPETPDDEPEEDDEDPQIALNAEHEEQEAAAERVKTQTKLPPRKKGTPAVTVE